MNGPLPHGAKGFDLGKAVFVAANDKLVVKSKAARHHFTLHFGNHSQILDIHETTEAAEGAVTHMTLFSIAHANLAAMLQDIALQAVCVLTGILRPLRPGWMAKRRVGAVVGLIPAESEIPHVTRLRHKKLVVDPEKLAARARTPEFLEDLYELADGEPFTVMSCKDQRNPRMIGIGFKFTDLTGRRRLVWFNRRRVGEVAERMSTLLQEAAKKYGTFHKPLPWF